MTGLLLADDIEKFVSTLLENASKNPSATRKVIHDPILGTNVFEPHEIALIDLPFCQRLRRISQTDVASLVFPSANHNRLEHSLGVATITGRIIQSIQSKPRSPKVPLEVEIAIRTAAILHDIGQGPFSHLTDSIIKRFPEVIEYRKKHPGIFSEHKPHEMLSYMIVKDSKFKNHYINEILKNNNSSKSVAEKVDIDAIADMIVAANQKDKYKAWQGDIINGPFDADKLDYLQRDAYFSGLKIGIDLERFLHSVWINKRDKVRRLKVMTSGAITLEQILFGKVLLYNTLYQHHKVLAAECALAGFFEILEDNPEVTINGHRMDRAIDFLSVSEANLLSLENKPTKIRSHLERFLYRDLLKRALVISSDTVVKPETSTGYAQFKELSEYPEAIKELRGKLVDALRGKYPIYDIWIVLPRTPTFSDEASMAKIQDPGGPIKSLRDPFRVDEWLTAYWGNKWTGYVFCPSDNETREEVGKAAAGVLEDEYHFKLKTSAFEKAKNR